MMQRRNHICGMQRKQAVVYLFRAQLLLCYHLLMVIADNIVEVRYDQAMSQDALRINAFRATVTDMGECECEERISM